MREFSYLLKGEGKLMSAYRNGNETFAAYKAAAAKATKNVPAANFRGGVIGSIPAAQAMPPPL